METEIWVLIGILAGAAVALFFLLLSFRRLGDHIDAVIDRIATPLSGKAGRRSG